MIVAPSEWLVWLRTRPRFFRAFLTLILIKPAIDIFWDTAVPSTSITILQAFGVILIFVVILSLIGRRPYQVVKETWSQFFLFAWLLLQLLNVILICASYLSLDVIALSLKISLPLYIVLFYRKYIFSLKDLDGILTTFYFSLAVPAVNFFYNLAFNQVFTPSRGLSRLETEYADVSNFGIAVNLSLVIVGYFLLRNSRDIRLYQRAVKLLYVNLALAALVLVNIHHAASSLIFAVLLILFWVYNYKQRGVFSLCLFLACIYFFHDAAFTEKINVLYKTDIAVVKGETEEYRAFHGRMGRWQRHFEVFSKQSGYAQLVGLAGLTQPSLIGHGPHNDYLRILFSSGYLGLLFYFLFLAIIFARSLNLSKNHKFLVHGILLFLVLQSMTLTPTTYHGVNFVFMAIVVWLQLPRYNRELDYSPIPIRGDLRQIPAPVPMPS